MAGTAGNDSITGTAGADSLSGLGGNDTLVGDNGYDTLDGGTGNDSLQGGGGDDVLWGGTGNDMLDTGAGADTAHGGDGDDTISGGGSGATGNLIYGDAGNDLIYNGSASDTAYGGDGNDTIHADQGADLLSGDGGDDQFVVSNEFGAFGSDTIVGGETAETAGDRLDASSMTSGLTVSMTGTEAGTLSDGTSTLRFSEIETIVLGSGADTFTGGAGNDLVDTGAGNDRVTAGAGADSIALGDGNDTLTVSSPDNRADTIDGGAGDDVITLGNGGSNDIVYGGAGNDTLSTSYDADAGNDTLYGGDGRDVFLAGPGDSIVGGEGGDDFDTIDLTTIPYVGASITLTGNGAGSASYASYTLNFTEIEAITGTVRADTIQGGAATTGMTYSTGEGNDIVTGGSGADSISGGSGNDTITGGAGADTLLGGTGADTFVIGTSEGYGDVIQGETGTDTVQFVASGNTGIQVTYTGADAFVFGQPTPAGIPAGTATGIEAITGTKLADSIDASLNTGSASYSLGAGNDSVTGGSGAETIVGGTGNDTLAGGAGDDSLDGSEGADTLDGGAGNDTLAGGADGDVIRVGEAPGNDVISGGETRTDSGTDQDTLSFGGSTPVDLVFSGAEAGSYRLTGGSGTFTGIEAVSGGSGNDTLDATASGAAVTLAGGAGNDRLTGGAGADSLSGGEGNDELRGGEGADVLTLGTGNDTVHLDALGANDTITDFNMADDGTGLHTVDQLDVADLTDGNGNPINWSHVTVSGTPGVLNTTVLTFPNGESITLIGVNPADVTGKQKLHSIGIPCFVEGTRLDTPRGPVAVENLRIGDLLVTRDGPPEPILWIGQRQVSEDEMQAEPRLCPIEIRPGALGNRAPVRLSAQHCVMLAREGAEVLVRAWHLARLGWKGARVMRGKRGCRYHHLLLPKHGLVQAEGLWAETFWPGPAGFAALGPAGGQALIDAHPRLAPALLGLAPVEEVYSQRVRPMAHPRDIARDAGPRPGPGVGTGAGTGTGTGTGIGAGTGTGIGVGIGAGMGTGASIGASARARAGAGPWQDHDDGRPAPGRAAR